MAGLCNFPLFIGKPFNVIQSHLMKSVKLPFYTLPAWELQTNSSLKGGLRLAVGAYVWDDDGWWWYRIFHYMLSDVPLASFGAKHRLQIDWQRECIPSITMKNETRWVSRTNSRVERFTYCIQKRSSQFISPCILTDDVTMICIWTKAA